MLFEILETIGQILFNRNSSSPESSGKDTRKENRACNWILAIGLAISFGLLLLTWEGLNTLFLGILFGISLLTVPLGAFILIKLNVLRPMTMINFFKTCLAISVSVSMLTVWIYQ
ncbi:hypothetical protein [Sphingobacterium faecale]|uniref:Uncharacterized protein n=1 Tax=Sphingobacterium faecale TaxID=2803775 RepID=A0ABS1RAR8_9SPHI|nr:hypothetical protein [Sphingobacterium faecale]MBL1411445.1 hypothetical protein [Sphingobacterium faecale]